MQGKEQGFEPLTYSFSHKMGLIAGHKNKKMNSHYITCPVFVCVFGGGGGGGGAVLNDWCVNFEVISVIQAQNYQFPC